MLKLLYRFTSRSRMIQRNLQNSRYHIDDPQLSYKAETNKIVEQLYFPQESQNQYSQSQIQEQQQYQQDPLRKIYSVAELLDYYQSLDQNLDLQQFDQIFKKMQYCIKNEASIMSRQQEYVKKKQGLYRQKNIEETQTKSSIFLTKTQIITNPILIQCLSDYCQISNLKQQTYLQKTLYILLSNPIFEFDYTILTNIINQKENILDNESQIKCINFLTYLLRDISNQQYSQLDHQKYAKQQLNEFYELFSSNNNGTPNVIEALNSFLIQKIIQIIESINYQILNVSELCDLCSLYQYCKLPVLPCFESEIPTVLRSNFSQLNVQQNLIVLDVYINKLKINDQQLYSQLLWNLVRFTNIITDFRRLINILKSFRQQVLFFKSNDKMVVLVNDTAIFKELFDHLQNNLSGLNSQQLSDVLKIGYNNCITQQSVKIIVAEIFKSKEEVNDKYLRRQYENIQQLTELGQTGLIKQVQQITMYKLSRESEISGYLQPQKQQVSQDLTQSMMYSQYYTKELDNFVNLVWMAINQEGNQNYEQLNALIFQINSQLKNIQIQKLQKNTIRKISQINIFIKYKGKKMFPNQIDINLVKQFSIKQDTFQHPISLFTQIFQKEKSYFYRKYQKFLQRDAWYENIFVDFILTNPESGDIALINTANSNFYQIHDIQQMNPLKCLVFNKQMMELTQIPITYVELPDMIRHHDHNVSYIENLLHEILPDVEEEFSELQESIIKLRQQLAISKIFDQIIDKKTKENTQQLESEEIDDTYQLSDQDQ